MVHVCKDFKIPIKGKINVHTRCRIILENLKVAVAVVAAVKINKKTEKWGILVVI